MVLLTLRTLKGIIRAFNLGRRFGCHPFEWNKDTQQAEISSSFLQKGTWIFNVALTFGYYGFITYKWNEVTSSETTSVAVKMFIRFALVFFSFPVFFQLTIMTSFRELPEFVNIYLRYNKRFERRYIPADSRPKLLCRFCEFIVVYVSSSFWLDFFAYSTMIFFRPTSPEQISTLVSTEMLNPGRLVLYGLFVYYEAGYVVNACLMIFTSFGFFFSAFQILQEFGPKRKWLKKNDPKILIRIYKILFLQIMGVDRVYKIITAAAKIILMLLAIYCTYGGMRLNGIVAVTLGVIGVSTTLFLAVIMTAWSEFHSSSARALLELVRVSTKERGRWGKYLSGEIKALRLLKIPVCGMYVIDKRLVLTVIHIVLDKIIFLLVNN